MAEDDFTMQLESESLSEDPVHHFAQKQRLAES